MLLETTVLHLGKDHMPWSSAFQTATGMSMVSMLAMELTENMITIGISNRVMGPTEGGFWIVTAFSMTTLYIPCYCLILNTVFLLLVTL